MARCDLLVTGAGGFVGTHLLALAHVGGLEARAAPGDLRDPDVADALLAREQPRAVVHLASARRTADPWATLPGDLAMTGCVLQATARHAPDAPVLVTGSAAQYGMGSERALAESDPTVPVSGYGAAKCVLERAVTAPPLAGSVRVIFARAFNHIGPGQGTDAPAGQWIAQAAAAETGGDATIRTGNLEVLRDFLDVRDVAAAYLALVRSDAHGVVNVCSGTPVAVGAITEHLAGCARTPLSFERDPAFVRATDPPCVVGDPGLLRAFTGWEPTIGLERSVRDQLEAARTLLAPSAIAQARP